MIRLLAATISVVLLASGVALANPDAQPAKDYFEVSEEISRVGATDQIAPAAPVALGETGAGATGVAYETQLLCGDADGNLRYDSLNCDAASIRCGDGDRGFMYSVTANLPDGSTEDAGTGCYLPQQIESGEVVAPAAPPRITPGLVLRAFERVPLPGSELVVQPPGGQTLVGLDTIFSTEAEGFTETVRLLGRSVELAITPSSYRWSHGDRTTQTTDWPGQAWRGSGDRYITHVYDDRMRVATSVDTTWTARYRVDGGAWQQVPGTVTIEGDPAALRVRSASPHLLGTADGR